MKHFRSPLACVLLATLLALAVLFHRTWRYGEIFSPADIVFSFYPWTYDAPLTPMTNSTRSDEAFFHQPLMETHWKRLKRGDWPDLDPDVLAGVPAFFQGLDVGRAFSPLSLPFYLTSAGVAVTLYAPLRLFAAAMCMWIYLRSLGLGGAASAAGALAFGLNGGFIVWLSAPMPTVALFLPATWWLVDRALGDIRSAPMDQPSGGRLQASWPGAKHSQPAHSARVGRTMSRRDLGWLSLAVGCLGLGAYVPTTLACLVVLAAYALVRVWTRAQWTAVPPLVGAGVLGLVISAVALVPMFDNLRSSPVSARTMTQAHVPWTNLATFFVPKFWGSPISANWWYPGVGSFPEFVTYLGVATVVFAVSGGTWWWMATRDRRAPLFGVLALGALAMMYGWPPVTWLTSLPGFKQMSPLRWNVVLAASTAVLAAWGVEWIAGAASDARSTAANRTTHDGGAARLARWLPAGSGLAALGVLGAVTAAALATHLPTIRALGLQPFLRGEIAWAAAMAAVSLLLVSFAAVRRSRSETWREDPLLASRARQDDGAASPTAVGVDANAARRVGTLGRWSRWAGSAPWPALAGGVCVALVASDLVRVGMGFNPTLPPERLYPSTPAIEFLQEHVPPNRFAPVGSGGELVNAHIWSVFGLSSVAGLDFYGDASYQEFLSAAGGEPFTGAKWDFVGLRRPEAVDLKLLGLLNVDYLALSPRDAGTALGGYLPLTDLEAGRVVRQSFECRAEGLHRVDVMTGTYGRANDGTVEVTLTDELAGETIARRELSAASLPSNDWLELDFAPRPDSAGRRYVLEVRAAGASAGRAAMLWSAVAAGNPLPPASVDGVAGDRVLWVRTFSAPSRVGDAALVYARDLNIYRNPHSRPRAWFARNVTIVPRDEHVERLRASTFDSADTVLVTERPAHRPTPRGRVASLDLSDADTRRISVDAPDGGLLVVGERWHRGWRATVDGAPAQTLVADAVLMAVAVPPGSREVRLQFVHPLVRGSMAVSALAALAALALVFFPSRRSSSSHPST